MRKEVPKTYSRIPKKKNQNFFFFLKPRQIGDVEQVSSFKLRQIQLLRRCQWDRNLLDRSIRCRGGVEIAIRKKLGSSTDS